MKVSKQKFKHNFSKQEVVVASIEISYENLSYFPRYVSEIDHHCCWLTEPVYQSGWLVN